MKLVNELERSWAKACDRGTFRLAHYSIQANHVHLIVEAKDADALGRGMNALGARLARAVNRVFSRRGPVLKDRYHHVVLKTPTQVRNALRYVLLNAKRVHPPPQGIRILGFHDQMHMIGLDRVVGEPKGPAIAGLRPGPLEFVDELHGTKRRHIVADLEGDVTGIARRKSSTA